MMSLSKDSTRNISGTDKKYTQSKLCEEVIPEDRYHAAYLIFYLLGCGALLPWNFFITANEYFTMKLNSQPKLVSTFQNYFSVASMGPNLFMMILNVFVMHKYSRYIRIVFSITIVMLMFCTTSVLVLVDTEAWTTQFFIITMIKMVVISLFVSAFQGALFGLAGMFPSRYIQAVMAGQGLGGFFACAASILSILDHSNPQTSAFGYFCTGALVLVICLAAYVLLERLPIVKYYTRDKKTCFCTCQCKYGCHRNDVVLQNTIALKGDAIEEISSNDVPASNPQYFETFKKILPTALSMFTTFFLTLSIFPSTTARIKSASSEHNDWTEKFFIPVGCFLVFNTFDYIGKTIPSFIQQPSSKHPWFLFILCCSRVVFLPLFAFCNVQPRINGSRVVFGHDAYPIIFMVLFALSNGYLGSLSAMYGPKMVSPNQAEIAATILAFCLVAGLAAGAGFSFVITPNI